MNFFVPKKLLFALVGAGILALGILIGLASSSFGEATLPNKAASEGAAASSNLAAAEESAFGPTQFSNSAATATSSAGLEQGKNFLSSPVRVIRVVDGDTIEIEGGERVRYIGIDTPETVDPRKTVQCFGVEASAKNKSLVEGKSVRLEGDVTDRDKYGRLLRYVWLDERLINLELVSEGYAHSYPYPPDVKYQDKISAAERAAREAGRGLWGECGSNSNDPDNSLKESADTSASSESRPDSCDIKGNISAAGEKIYHLPGCGSYAKTSIDPLHGEKWFCSESEALAAGWRKAKNCP